MRRIRIAGLFLPALLLAAGTLRAQQVPSPFRYIEHTQSAGVFGGWVFSDPEILLRKDRPVEFGARPGPMVGVRYEGRIAGPASATGSIAFMPTKRRVYLADVSADSTQVTPTFTGTESNVRLLMADAGFRFNVTGPRTWHRLAPFATANFGIVADLAGSSPAEDVLPDNEKFEFGPSIALGVGIGTEWFPSDRLSVRIDLTDRLWRLKIPQGFLLTPNASDAEWTHNFGVSIGGALHF